MHLPINAHLVITIFTIVVVYYMILAFLHRKKLLASLSNSFPLGKPAVSNLMTKAGKDTEQFPFQLIDKPADHPQEQIVITVEDDPFENAELELVDDRGGILLKEAEKLVEQIQDTVNHIASNPPNAEEVYSKIRAIVSRYKLFENTEYYEAINSFVAITVERDCTITFTPEEIQALWN